MQKYITLITLEIEVFVVGIHFKEWVNDFLIKIYNNLIEYKKYLIRFFLNF